ncbi:sporulation membrane protein YtaF [Clostridium hydrogeniformans]|uniref:sporulation membrane protein YtaF n=1 Tax=Clostridium hydrogeniformans TaxID=349933 RepID=UPI000480C72A|nr:sporulation membrane protein YtaF [Clostridium hydrogeniformans]
MSFFSALILAISASLDSLSVGVAYGSDNIKVSLKNITIISLITALGTLISMILGYFLSTFLTETLANAIGSILLIFIGLWFIISFFYKKDVKDTKIQLPSETCNYKNILGNPSIADTDNSKSIDTKECICLSIALSLNNLGLGISASITGINPLTATLLTFLIGMICFLIGFFIGKKFLSKYLGNYSGLFSGILILALAVFQLFF